MKVALWANSVSVGLHGELVGHCLIPTQEFLMRTSGTSQGNLKSHVPCRFHVPFNKHRENVSVTQAAAGKLSKLATAVAHQPYHLHGVSAGGYRLV